MITVGLIYDGSYLLHRMYAQAETMIRRGQTNVDRREFQEQDRRNVACYLTLNSLYLFLSKSHPDAEYFDKIPLMLLLDGKGSTGYRRQLNENYKANRNHNDGFQEFKQQILGYFDLIGIPHFESTKYEADDIAYALSTMPESAYTFVTDDKDWYSCVASSHCKLYSPRTKSTVTRETLLSDYRPVFPTTDDYPLLPKVINYYKALLGDKSDNIEGFKGIGDVKSRVIIRKMLKHYPQIENYKYFVLSGAGARGRAEDVVRDGAMAKALGLSSLRSPSASGLGASASGNEERTQKYEYGLAQDWDRFLQNVQILGYDHVVPEEILPQVEAVLPKEISSMEINGNLQEIAEQIQSNTIAQNSYQYSLVFAKVTSLHDLY